MKRFSTPADTSATSTQTRSTAHLGRALITSLLLASGLALSIAPAEAHHAFAAEYDGNLPIVASGTVTKVQWVNPHSWLYLDIKGSDGKVTNWGFEFGAPFSLKEQGLNKTSLPIGTAVTVHGFKAKSGLNYAYASTVTLPDGKVYKVGGAGDAPPAPGAKPTTNGGQ